MRTSASSAQIFGLEGGSSATSPFQKHRRAPPRRRAPTVETKFDSPSPRHRRASPAVIVPHRRQQNAAACEVVPVALPREVRDAQPQRLDIEAAPSALAAAAAFTPRSNITSAFNSPVARRTRCSALRPRLVRLPARRGAVRRCRVLRQPFVRELAVMQSWLKRRLEMTAWYNVLYGPTQR